MTKMKLCPIEANSIMVSECETVEVVDFTEEHLGKFIGRFDKEQFLLGYSQLERKDAVLIAHFLSYLTQNGYKIVRFCDD